MKIYAKQVPPEYQDGYYLLDDDFIFSGNVIIYGNRDHKGYNGDQITTIERMIDDILSMYENDYYKSFYKTFSEACNDILNSGVEHKPYTTKQVHAIKEFCKSYDYRQERENYIFMLELLTRKKWDYQSIRGCVQREWNYIYYSDEISPETVDYIECIYFNMGTEWIIDDSGEFDPETDSPDDISGCGYYSTEYQPEKIAKEIQENFGTPGDTVILYEFSGFSRIARYMEVTA